MPRLQPVQTPSQRRSERQRERTAEARADIAPASTAAPEPVERPRIHEGWLNASYWRRLG